MDTLISPEIESAAGQTLSIRAYTSLLDMILRGKIVAGEAVTERQIAGRLGISRTPVREAVRRLEGEGTLERQRSGALVVRPYSLEEFLQALSVRRLLEGEAARLAAGKMSAEVLAAARARTARLRADGMSETARQDDHDFHAAIAEASGNPVLATSIADLRRRTAMFRLGRLPERVDQVCDEHLAILSALARADGDAARAAVHAHLDNVRAHLLQRLVELGATPPVAEEPAPPMVSPTPAPVPAAPAAPPAAAREGLGSSNAGAGHPQDHPRRYGRVLRVRGATRRP
ncbi:MAG: GntR family transcriptional regulator [Proteobacteria bacterium]|nr:GntR family transcriptional regulator [Pseudomonadota bacterium]